MSKSIAVLGSDQVPLAYTVPVPGTLTTLAASAVFNGSAAAAFIPCLSLYDSDGNLISRATAPEVAAGDSAEVSWFPGLGLAAASATGAVVGAYVIRTTTDTFGPVSGHPMKFNVGSIVTNDAATFTQSGNQKIILAHGGLVMAGLTGLFGTNGGVAYAGEFQMQTEILDSLSNPADQLIGPDIYTPELYATDPGDTFEPSGYSVWNCDDTALTPPYTLTASIDVLKNVTFTSYAMFVAILSPTGLT